MAPMENTTLTYRVYPTLLDAYQLYVDGILSRQDLADRINRVQAPPVEAIQKGVAFEMCVKSPLPIYEFNGIQFEPDIVNEVRRYIPKGGTWGQYLSAEIETTVNIDGGINKAVVNLYGYADYIYRDLIIDVKTGASYELGKYSNRFQHAAYMLSYFQLTGYRPRFRYLVTDFYGVYTEDYAFDEQECTSRLRAQCTDLIYFIHNCQRRGLIEAGASRIFEYQKPTQ